MTTEYDTVRTRMETMPLTDPKVALLMGALVVGALALLFAADPASHEALHDFRHAAGIACH